MASLQRALRRGDLVALAINAIIGAGIFGLPAKAYALTGAYSLPAFAACGFLAALIVLCFAEVSSRYQTTGGPYLYAREAFGPLPGFTVGWLWWLSRVAAYAANANLLVGYGSFFFPVLAHPGGRASVLTGLTAILLLLNVAGIRDAATASNFFTAGKLAALFFFIAAGLPHVDPRRLALGQPPSVADFSTAVLLLVYAFTGFEMAVVPAGEVQNPQRQLPPALLTAVGVVIAVYLCIQAVCIGTLPELAQSARPLADAAQRFLGSRGAAVITAGAVVSILGNLNVLLMSSARIPFAMAERGELPAVLAWTHPRRQTPGWALAVTAAVILGLTLAGTFLSAVTISSVARLMVYGATAVALLVLRSRPNAPAAQFLVPGGALVGALTLVLTLWLLAHTNGQEARDAALATLLGLALYGVTRWCGKSPAAASPASR